MKKIIKVLILIILGVLTAFSQPAGDLTVYMGVSWSPDGKYLAFTQSELKAGPPRSMKADIYVMKADGSEVKKITGEPGNEIYPSWSNDGKQIVFMDVRPELKESDIFLINRDGTGLFQLTKGTARNGSPVFSPDGQKIVFCSNRETNDEKVQVYVMKRDGSAVKRLTTDSSTAFYNPVWSPDGKKIVYYAEKGDQKDQIWTMNADGSNPTLLTGGTGHNFYPFWSADGKKIIFSGFREPNVDMKKDSPSLYLMNSDGTNLTLFGNLKGSGASFSPDGKKVAFIGGKFPVTGIYVANADGSNVVRLIGN